MLSTPKIFLLTLLLHFFADFNLQIQGTLHDLKSKAWWGKACHDTIWGSFDAQFKKYGHDYIAGLVCHSLFWSLVTFAPILWLASDLFSVLCVVLNSAFHYYVDDLKVNRYRINLWQGQLLHLLQISATVAAWHWIG